MFKLTRASTLKLDLAKSESRINVRQQLKKYSTRLNIDFVVRPNCLTPVYSPAPKPSKLLLDYINSPSPPKFLTPRSRFGIYDKKKRTLPNLILRKSPLNFAKP